MPNGARLLVELEIQPLRDLVMILLADQQQCFRRRSRLFGESNDVLQEQIEECAKALLVAGARGCARDERSTALPRVSPSEGR